MMEHSAGMVLYRERKGKREYLLLKSTYRSTFWGFPKGLIEAGESELQTALREVSEETGLFEIEVISGFEEKTHFWKTVKGKKVYKEVIWFLGKVLDKNDGKVSSEHEELVWLPFEEAIVRVTHKQEKELLRKAEGKISQVSQYPLL